jgi:hypothetical protein
MSEKPRRLGAIKTAVRLIVAAIVLYAVGRHVGRTWADMQAKGLHLQLRWGVLAFSGVVYLLGIGCQGAFYARILKASPTPSGWYTAIRAYYVSHLGKYVPGKALAVVIRAGLVVPYGVRPATAAVGTLYETFVMMTAGGLTSAIAFGISPHSTVDLGTVGGVALKIPMALLGMAVGLGFLLLVWPTIFVSVATFLKKPLKGIGDAPVLNLSPRLLAEGVAWGVACWVLLGLSQVIVIDALLPGGLPASAWPAVIGSVALATVAGFVVLISPGGLGVREWVLWTALASTIDADLAVVAALALRLAWIGAEILVSAAVMAVRPRLLIRPEERAEPC